MKRYDKISNRYSIIMFGLLIFAIIYWSGKAMEDMEKKCTPSQEHQKVMSGINDIKQAFCNGDGCRLDYETYQEKTR